MAEKFEMIMPGVYLRGKSDRNPGTVYFRKMFNGKRIAQRASVQGALAIDVKGRPTKLLKAEAANWAASQMNKAYIEKREGAREMTFRVLLEEYPKAAQLERVKSGKPSAKSVENTVKGIAQFLKVAGLSLDDKCSKLTTDLFDITITQLISTGRSKATAWSYAAALQGAAARWTGPYYRRENYTPPVFQLPAKRNMRPARYARPTNEQLDAVKAWYDSLWKEQDKRKWLAATLMLQFAMRNGDAERAKPEIFEKRLLKSKTGESVERIVLHYTPRKTSTSSARSVAWPVAPALWERIETARKEILLAAKAEEGRGWWLKCGEEEKNKLIPFGHMTYIRINKELRKIFPDAKKASYELRKICVDHVYQNMGLEKASAISGDDPKTVMYYYADPSRAVEEEGLDITNLL